MGYKTIASACLLAMLLFGCDAGGDSSPVSDPAPPATETPDADAGSGSDESDDGGANDDTDSSGGDASDGDSADGGSADDGETDNTESPPDTTTPPTASPTLEQRRTAATAAVRDWLALSASQRLTSLIRGNPTFARDTCGQTFDGTLFDGLPADTAEWIVARCVFEITAAKAASDVGWGGGPVYEGQSAIFLDFSLDNAGDRGRCRSALFDPPDPTSGWCNDLHSDQYVWNVEDLGAFNEVANEREETNSFIGPLYVWRLSSNGGPATLIFGMRYQDRAARFASLYEAFKCGNSCTGESGQWRHGATRYANMTSRSPVENALIFSGVDPAIARDALYWRSPVLLTLVDLALDSQ